MTLAAPSALEARLAERLGDALERYGVPGAVAGVSVGDETALVAAGVRNVRTGDPVTPGSIFPLGSVTKVLQATLLMSFGLPLDDPVRKHLPDFRCADADAADAITIRQLLDHSSGLEGDFFPELGWGEDAVARLIEACAGVGQLHPPGLLASYCNTGVNIGGRIVEVKTGSTWDEAIRERLFAPGGMDSTVSLPWQAIQREVAVGHVPGDGGPVVAPSWSWPRSISPAGGTLASTAGDLLRFARLHLDGVAPVGAEIASAMTEVQRPWPTGLSWPDGSPLTAMGLGWFLHDRGETRLLGHDGAGLGCAASLRLVPDRDVAVVCISNAWYGGYSLNGEVVRGVLEDELGPAPAATPAAPEERPVDRYVGTYRRLGSLIEIKALPDGSLAAWQQQDLLHDSSQSTTESELDPVGPDLFHARNPAWALQRTYRFVTTAGERPDYLYQGMRAHRRDG